MAKPPSTPRLYVVAGANGAGKSSILGAMILEQGVEYFNPDAATRLIQQANPGIAKSEANSIAWYQGKRLLELAIAHRRDFAFETTLGGRTMTALLLKALAQGFEVKIWFVGLDSPELHIARVRSRVRHGGHDIPEDRIRQRFTHSRLHLVQLLPHLTELFVYDNSEDADPAQGQAPEPRLILHLSQGRIVASCDLTTVPEWAKPVVAAALKLQS